MTTLAIVFIFLLPLVNCQQGIKFFYYTPESSEIPIEFEASHLPPLSNSSSEGNPRIKIICHGWIANSTVDWMKQMVAKYLKSGESNVIAVDWSVYAKEIYPLAQIEVPSVGRTIGEAIININKQWNVSFSDIHLIGHSLGAHAMGFASKHIIAKGYAKVGRITGLDPAGPGYDFVLPNMRLSSKDASFVDIIHTNSGVIGYIGSLGQVDFWPNGGESQPGCGALTSCSHIRAPLYFIESIDSDAFPSWYCHSQDDFDEGECDGNQMIYMGYWAPPFIRGDYYLDTNAQPPFGTD